MGSCGIRERQREIIYDIRHRRRLDTSLADMVLVRKVRARHCSERLSSGRRTEFCISIKRATRRSPGDTNTSNTLIIMLRLQPSLGTQELNCCSQMLHGRPASFFAKKAMPLSSIALSFVLETSLSCSTRKSRTCSNWRISDALSFVSPAGSGLHPPCEG